jgi:hypothetical protein
MEKTIHTFKHKKIRVFQNINETNIAKYIGVPILMHHNKEVQIGNTMDITICNDDIILKCELNQQGKELIDSFSNLKTN